MHFNLSLIKKIIFLRAIVKNGKKECNTTWTELMKEEISEYIQQARFIMDINIIQQLHGTKEDNTAKFGEKH